MDGTTESVSSQAVVAQLDRLCESSTFRNSSRLCRFLRYTVEAALRGEGETLKEYSIGVDVYDRRQPYNPSQDSIVRTEAKRLRNKLKEYYEREGVEDDVLIYYRSGTYQPTFRRSVPMQETPGGSPNRTSGNELPGVTFAVLPFRHREGDPEAAAIAAGVTDDLIFRITATDGCRVVASPSVAMVQSQTSDMSVLTNVLKVDQIITGSVRKEGSHVRLVVTGVHPSGLETWSEKLDFTTSGSDVMFLEEQAASAIMARVSPQGSAVRCMSVKVPAICLSTFPEMLSAEGALDQGTSSSLRAALANFENLAVRQPESSRVHCGIAQSYYLLALIGQVSEPAEVQRAKAAAAEALQLDPGMGEAYAAMACAYVLEHDCERAEEMFRHALTLRPSPTIRQPYADMLMSLGRFDEAAMQLSEARRVDPFSVRQRVSTARLRYLTWSNAQMGVLEDNVQYGPMPNQILLFQAELALRMGKMKDATFLAETILWGADQGTATMADVAAIFTLAGQTEKARSLIDQFQLLDERASLSKTYQARLCCVLRDEDACRSFLELAVARAEPQLSWVKTDPRFEGLLDQIDSKQMLETLKTKQRSQPPAPLTVS